VRSSSAFGPRDDADRATLDGLHVYATLPLALSLLPPPSRLDQPALLPLALLPTLASLARRFSSRRPCSSRTPARSLALGPSAFDAVLAKLAAVGVCDGAWLVVDDGAGELVREEGAELDEGRVLLAVVLMLVRGSPREEERVVGAGSRSCGRHTTPSARTQGDLPEAARVPAPMSET